MRSLLLIPALMAVLHLGAQSLVQSVAAGDWTDPATWDCGCAPQDGDSVVVQHQVTLDTDVTLLGGRIDVMAGAGLSGVPSRTFITTAAFHNAGQVQLHRLILPEASAWTDSLVNNGVMSAEKLVVRRRGRNTGLMSALDSLVFDHSSFWNEATVVARVAWVRDSLLWNAGRFTAYDLTVDSSGLFHNADSCTVTHDLIVRHTSNFNAMSSTFNLVAGDMDLRWGLNMWDALFTVGGRLHLSDADGPVAHVTFFTPGGRIHTGDLLNEGWLAGPGTVCIADSSINAGSLQAGLVICDATPTTTQWPYLDVDQGTVDPGVLFCPPGSCSVAIAEQHLSDLVVAPNPTSGLITVTGLGDAGGTWSMYDATGRMLEAGASIARGRLELDLSGHSSGLYVLRLCTEEGCRAFRVIRE